MKKSLLTFLLLMLLAVALMACGGDENNPLSTGEQGGQVTAPDTLEGATDVGAENAEENAVDNEGQNVDEDVADQSVEPGDAETIGDGTGGQGNTTTGGEALSADDPSFLSDWTSDGAMVEVGGEVPASLFEGASGQTYIVDDVTLQVYRFEDEASAEDAAGTISSDGGMINDVSVRWAGPPHFYRMGDTIVVYIGDDAATLDRLSGTFGTPFAGTGASG